MKKLKINEDKFNEEIERIERYLNMISNNKMGPSECISILEDFGIIEDRGDLDKYQIIEELSNHLGK